MEPKPVVSFQECKKCVNSSKNPYIKFNEKGYCHICEVYMDFDPSLLAPELRFFESLIGSGKGKYDIMVGLSGGKDSSATLYRVKEMGFTPLAFTLDTGYFPDYIFRRAKNVAENKCDVDYKVISTDKYVTKKDRRSFKKMSQLYLLDDEHQFKKDYKNGREGYKGVVRPCWVCRKILIRAYYAEALRHGVKAVVLGINEWTSLKKTTSRGEYKISAIRRLKPFKNKPEVHIVHFPFLMQTDLKQTKKILKKIGWNYYQNVQSNAYSCMLANATEYQSYRNLGFHPDTTRLAREVTVGFLTKTDAEKALKRPKKPAYTLQKVLEKAKLVE